MAASQAAAFVPVATPAEALLQAGAGDKPGAAGADPALEFATPIAGTEDVSDLDDEDWGVGADDVDAEGLEAFTDDEIEDVS